MAHGAGKSKGVDHGVLAACESTIRRRQRRGQQVMVVTASGVYFEPNLEHIALDEELGRMALRILLLARGGGGRDNVLPYSQVALAKRFGVSRQAVQQAMGVLIKKGLMVQEGHQYQLNSRIATHQDVMGLVERRRDEQRQLRQRGLRAEL